MKRFFYLVLINIGLLFSCNPNNDIDTYYEFANIKFTVTSTDSDRLSKIETSISNGVDDTGSSKLHIVDESYSYQHLPYEKEYIHQQVFNFTSLSIFYQDNSGAPIGSTFTPYTVTLTIYVDDEIVSEKEVMIEETNTPVFTEYSFSFIN